jgi:TfoX/Sxy family transcriptional regulator of competence genes
MAYDEALAERVRKALRSNRAVTERKMFGGIAFMLRGHMFVGISGESLMARVGPQNYQRALAMKSVRKMDFTGRPMRGYVFVEPSGLKSPADLERWVQLCADFVATLPPKAPSQAARA